MGLEQIQKTQKKNCTNDLEDKVSLNTLNNYILGATLVTDLLSDTYMLPITKSDMIKNGSVNGAKIK